MIPHLFSGCTPRHPAPILQIHHTTDDVVHYRWANWIRSIDDAMRSCFFLWKKFYQHGEIEIKIPHLFLVSVFLIIFADINLPAQDIAGTITYQQITKLDFTTVFDAEAMVRVTNYFGGEFPEATTAHKILSFTSTSSLFKNSSIAESVDPKMQRLTMHLGVMRPPRPKLEKLYFDFEKDEKVEQVDFMTRTFCIVDEIKNPAWKLTNKSTKILNYSCTSAELKKVMISFSPISPLKFPSPLVRMNSLVCPDSFSLLRKTARPSTWRRLSSWRPLITTQFLVR